jgi:lauroyl/myristoyl acyltransferase
MEEPSQEEQLAGLAARVVVEMASRLVDGGLVVMQGDGLKGRVKTHVPVLGRMYPFRSGFAELAAQTGAIVLPTTIDLEASGKVRIVLHTKLDSGPENEPHETRITNLISQYAAFIEKSCWSHPESLTLGRMRKHLKLPVAPTGD